ncbi:MAG: cupin domain-containing protein [Hyphomicrobiales bacterium]
MGGESAPMTVMAMTVASEQGAPDHISHGEDKVFQIMQGNLIFSVGTNKIKASPGEVIFVGRGVAHSFSALNGEPAVMMLIATPAKHDRFFAAMDALPSPHNISEVHAVCERFDQSIVGPVVK